MKLFGNCIEEQEIKLINNNNIRNVQNVDKEEKLKQKCALWGHTKESRRKILTYLSRRGWVGEFAVEPIHAHSYKLPHRVPIRVGEV